MRFVEVVDPKGEVMTLLNPTQVAMVQQWGAENSLITFSSRDLIQVQESVVAVEDVFAQALALPPPRRNDPESTALVLHRSM